jgi:hypothetical protein
MGCYTFVTGGDHGLAGCRFSGLELTCIRQVAMLSIDPNIWKWPDLTQKLSGMELSEISVMPHCNYLV